MKSRVPPDCSALSHGGTIYEIDPGSTVEAAETDAAALATHGIHPDSGPGIPDASTVCLDRDIETMTRDELEAVLRSRGAREPFPKHIRKLRSLLRNMSR